MPLVLLPPSETKREVLTGPKLNLKKLAFPELISARQEVQSALIKLSSGPKSKARSALKLTANQDAQLELNQRLATAPTAPAWQVYDGVLYDALGASSLSQKSLNRLCEIAFVQSALYGLISLGDSIAPYRLSGDCNLPKVGSIATFWNRHLSNDLLGNSELLIDLRSGIYAKHLSLPDCETTVIPKIMQRMKSGPPKVVSHHSKATKGRILRALVESRRKVTSVTAFAELVATLDADVELKRLSAKSEIQVLEVVVDL